MKISKSKINTYKTCPRQFQYTYIDKIPSEPNQYMQLGLDVHKIAEHVGAELQFKDNIDDDIIIEAFENNYFESEFDIAKHMENLFFFFKSIFDSGYKILNVEDRIYDKESNVNGIVDLVLENSNDDDLVIIDYKTSKSKPITNYRLELCMYKKLVESKYVGRTVSSAAIFFTKDGQFRGLNFVEEQEKGCYITTDDYESVFKYIDFILKKINTKQFEPKKQFLCDYCAFKERCDNDGGF